MAASEEFNAYPTSTPYFFNRQPDDQTKSVEKEIQDTLDQLPLIKEVLDRLDEKIAFYDSLSSIQVDIDADPLTFQKVHAANELTKQNLGAERSYILARVEKAALRKK